MAYDTAWLDSQTGFPTFHMPFSAHLLSETTWSPTCDQLHVDLLEFDLY